MTDINLDKLEKGGCNKHDNENETSIDSDLHQYCPDASKDKKLAILISFVLILTSFLVLIGSMSIVINHQKEALKESRSIQLITSQNSVKDYNILLQKIHTSEKLVSQLKLRNNLLKSKIHDSIKILDSKQIKKDG